MTKKTPYTDVSEFLKAFSDPESIYIYLRVYSYSLYERSLQLFGKNEKIGLAALRACVKSFSDEYIHNHYIMGDSYTKLSNMIINIIQYLQPQYSLGLLRFMNKKEPENVYVLFWLAFALAFWKPEAPELKILLGRLRGVYLDSLLHASKSASAVKKGIGSGFFLLSSVMNCRALAVWGVGGRYATLARPLLKTFGLEERVLYFISGDAGEKRFLEGKPVYSPEEAVRHPVDAIVVASCFHEQIRQKAGEVGISSLHFL